MFSKCCLLTHQGRGRRVCIRAYISYIATLPKTAITQSSKLRDDIVRKSENERRPPAAPGADAPTAAVALFLSRSNFAVFERARALARPGRECAGARSARPSKCLVSEFNRRHESSELKAARSAELLLCCGVSYASF